MELTSTQVRAIARVLPDALQPTWAEQTWSGTFGSRSLRALVEETTGSLHLTRESVRGELSAIGEVFRRTSEVGELVRSVELRPTGELVANHGFLELEDAVQGTGFARAFNDHAFARYADGGVERVELNASLEVGGYAWARQGFELLSDEVDEADRVVARGQLLARFVREARDSGAITAAQAHALEPRLVDSWGRLPPDALTSVQELAAMPEVGRSVLLGQSWAGVRPIERTRSWWSASPPTGPADARAAAARLRGAVAEQLPALHDPDRLGAAIERRTGRPLRGAETVLRREHELTSIDTTATLDVAGRPVPVLVSSSPGRPTTVSLQAVRSSDAATGDAVAEAFADLGLPADAITP